MSDELKVTAKLYIVYVRSTAEVCEITLLIACDCSILKSIYKIELVLVILEHLKSFFLGYLLADDLLAALGNLLHLFLDGCEIFLASDNVIAEIYIVVESFCNYRSYPELCLWVQMLDSLCHKMCTGMIQCLKLFVFFEINHVSSPSYFL